MKNPVDKLFNAFHSDKLALDNRIVMAPMTRSRSPDGIPGEDVVAYYQRRAQHGVGLILTEGAVINHPAAAADPNVPHFFGAEALNGWAKVVQAVHAVGGKIMPQLWHIGLMRMPGNQPNPEAHPIGPSGMTAAGDHVTELMNENEIQNIINGFASAARSAQLLGFDGVELHGAHGYLIDQFLWSATNQRADRYGGSMAQRTRFAAEIIRACRSAVGPSFPIVFRFSQWKVQDFNARPIETPDQLSQFLTPLLDAGVDIFHCSTRRFWEPAFVRSDLTLAGWTKRLSGKPTIAVGSIGLDGDFLSAFVEGKGANNMGIDRVIKLLDDDEADLFAVGRALLVDPAWANKIRHGMHDQLHPFSVTALQELA